jgi:hypothetical protein
MVPPPPWPVSKGGSPYAQHVRPRRCLSFGRSAFNPLRVRSVSNGFRCFGIWYETQTVSVALSSLMGSDHADCNRRFLTLVSMASLTTGICPKDFGPWIAGIIPGSIISVVSLHFVCLSLAFIYQARGKRRCMGVRWVCLPFFVI